MSRLKEKALITPAHIGEESQPPRLVCTVYPRFVSLVTFSTTVSINGPPLSPEAPAAVAARPRTRTPPTFQDSSEPSRLARRVRLTALAERSAQADSPPIPRGRAIRQRVPRRYARAVARLRFRLSTGEEVFKTIESDDQVPAEIDAFRNHQGEYGAEFFPADDGLWVLRLAVISMGPVDDTPLST